MNMVTRMMKCIVQGIWFHFGEGWGVSVVLFVMVSPWIIYVCKGKGSETLPVAASPFWEPQWFTRAPLCTSNKGIEARFSDGVFHCYMAHVQAIGKTYWESTQGRYIIYSIHSSSFVHQSGLNDLMLGDFDAFWGDFRQISSTSGLKWPKVLRSWAVRDYSKEYWSCSKSCHARTNITNVLSIAPYIERTAGADDLIIMIVIITTAVLLPFLSLSWLDLYATIYNIQYLISLWAR